MLADPLNDSDAAVTLRRAEVSATVSLLFLLEEGFPSQQTYFRHVRSLTALQLDWSCQLLQWITTLRALIAAQNYSQLCLLTELPKVNSIVDGITALDSLNRDLLKLAFRVIVDGLRRKLRNSVWIMLRVAYRDFNLSAGSTTPVWLARSLLLDSISVGGDVRIDDWMKERQQEGHCTPKEGIEGRWTLRRPT